MFISKKTLFAAACTFVLSAPAFAGVSLSSLFGGGTLTSDNGLLEFSDFQYTPIRNAPAAADIDIQTLDSGLLFGTPIFTDSSTGFIDFGISYKVSGIGASIVSAQMQSTGSGFNGGAAGVIKVVEGSEGQGLANLINSFSSSTTLSNVSALLAPQDSIYVRDDVFALPGQGVAALSDFSQVFGTTTEGETAGPTAVPSPTAALAGVLLLGAIGVRRRRDSK
ncbi:MAG: hypothetical protein AB8C95_09070 [Phycisphaeraceae bacterium]